MHHKSTSLIILLLAAATITTSCKKHGNTASDNSIQHRWHITSLNGTGYRFAGKSADYWDFGNSDTLIQFIGGQYDTVTYSLINGGKTVVITDFFSFAFADTLDIKTLNGSQLILAGKLVSGYYLGSDDHILDSLRR